jgi:hypothetical protein
VSQHFPFDRDDVFPSFFANRLQDFLSGLESRLALRIASPNTVSVQATSDADGMRAVSIDGRWRYNTATVTRAVSGAVGLYTVWATAAENDIDNTPQPFTDNTNYSFGLAVTAGSAAPSAVPGSVDIWRELGTLWWDGARIVELTQKVGVRTPRAGDLVAAPYVIDSGHPAPSGTIVVQGQDVNVADYPALFGRVGYVHSGGSAPSAGKFRLPDAQGRMFIGLGSATPVNAVAKNDGFALASRSPQHTHTVAGHTHTLPSHTHLVPGHWHGRGTLAISSAVTSLSIAAAGSHSHGGQTGIPNEEWARWDPVPYGNEAFSTYANTGYFAARSIGPTNHAHSISVDGNHSHGVSDPGHAHSLTGSIGNTGGSVGDSGFASGAPTSFPESGSAAPGTSTATIPFTTGVWLITTGE